jgi:hypothetical protein
MPVLTFRGDGILTGVLVVTRRAIEVATEGFGVEGLLKTVLS